jgi:hypothetical protein
MPRPPSQNSAPRAVRRLLFILLCSLSLLPGMAGPARAAFVTAATYGSGKIVSPRMIAVMWGTWTSTERAAIDNYLKGLAAYMTRSTATTVPGMDPTVRQYGVWGAYYPGASQGSMVIDPNPIPKNADGTDAQVAEFGIDAELARLQTSGLLPASTIETLFVVFTKGVRVVLLSHAPPGSMPAELGNRWCGYHDWTRGTDGQSMAPNGRVFALVPTYAPQSGCNTTLTARETTTSHEVFEAATDPDGHGWSSAGAGEVGDVCQADATPTAPLTLPDGTAGVVANIIDNIGSTCSIYSPEQTPPLSAVKTGTTTINIFAQDSNGVPRQISGDGVSWGSPQNLGGVISEAPTAISADGRTIDVFARGMDGGVYRWFFDGSNWSGPSGLGGVIIGPPSAVFNTVRGKAVYARGTDGVIYLLQDGGINSWSWSALPMPTGILAISPPQVFAQTSTCDHIYFTGTDGHLYHSAACSDVPTPFGDLGGVVLNRLGFAVHPSNTARTDIFIDGPVVGGGAFPFQKTFTTTVTPFTSLGGVVVGAPSAAALGTSEIRLFARGAGGTAGSGLFQDIASNGSNFGGWGQLDTVSISSAPLAFTPNNFAINVLLRRTDGELLQKRFDGVNWQSIQDLNLRVR